MGIINWTTVIVSVIFSAITVIIITQLLFYKFIVELEKTDEQFMQEFEKLKSATLREIKKIRS